ncbi:polysaccharide biosynthesis C-terminal domain-containing protein, partial [bacterium]|nr:polysaccharide biosynthesis C-terminal domain-containing protein [bacterium]
SISYGWIGFLILKTVFSVSAVYMGMGLIELIVIHSVLKFLQPAYYLWEIRRGKPELQFKIDWRFSGHLIAAAWRLALLIIVTTIFWRLDTIMLSKMATNVKVANYQAAFKMFWFAMLMLRSFFVAIFPMMSSMFVERRADFERACRKSIRYLVLLALPIGIIVSTYAPQFMPWLWGTKYPEASGVLQILIWALLPFSISEILGQALLASKNEMTNLVLNSIVLVIKFGLNYWLIQQYGIAGVGYATVIMLSILVIMQLPFVIPNLMKVEWKKVISAMGRTISIAGLLLGLAIMCKNIHFIPGMVLLAIVYLVMLFLFRVIHINDRARLTGWMKKRA